MCASAYPQKISDYNVIWDTPSVNSSGSMPLGNGELGLNVWVERNGDLLFYLSRTDAISEANRLMKIGRIRVSMSPNPFTENKPFTQKLLLDEGVIEITADKATIRIFIDPDNNVAYLTLKNGDKTDVTVTAESWRRSPHIISAGESASAWTTQPLPSGLRLEESADIFFSDSKALSWCHFNDWSVYDITMKHQQKTEYTEYFPDPIKNRAFGAYITTDNLSKLNDSTFKSKSPINTTTLKIATLSKQVDNKDSWNKEVKTISGKSLSAKAESSSKIWWSNFWNRSYIYVDTPKEGDLGYRITQAYILQRFMAASSGRGNYPIKFNGSIFTVDPVYTNGAKLNPDFRNWGNDFWWQNTRLPYYAMLQTGDFEQMQPLFNFYLGLMKAQKCLASKYYGVKGAFIPETMTIFGTYANGDYGWDREGATPTDVRSQYIGKIWVQSLEFSKLMLDYYSYSGDKKFLTERALPAIKEYLLYFDSRFTDSRNGKLRITPTQSLETYWYNVVNDMPVVAGLHAVTKLLKSLPEDVGTSEDRALWNKIENTLPALPTLNTAEGEVYIPASEYMSMLSNVENPELYPVFPFGISNLTNDKKDIGIRSFKRRVFDSGTGWGQDGQHTAMLGLVGPTIENLKIKIANTNSSQRFIAMWGPNYDWVPDQDHGSNLLMTLQYMILQSYEGENYILPTWCSDWKVKYKLYGPNQTVVEGSY